jgi:Flp pilus assembly protein TadG
MGALRMLVKENNLLEFARQVIAKLAAIKLDKRGTAAIEFSFFAGLLTLGMLNMTDVSIYLYQRMEVENAAQMAVQAAWKTCNPNNYQVPATTKCPGLTTAITNAVQSTSLGTKVSLQSGSPAEGYYCVNKSGALQYVSDVSSKPADCTAAGMPSLQPGDYIKITTTFSYTPMFDEITVADRLPSPITKTSMMRLD